MRLLVITLMLACNAPHAADFDDTPNPWWGERGSESLPSLVAKGWKIVGFSASHGDNTFSQDYVLHHPSERGAWWCNWLSIVLRDGKNDIIASCSKLRESTIAE